MLGAVLDSCVSLFRSRTANYIYIPIIKWSIHENLMFSIRISALAQVIFHTRISAAVVPFICTDPSTCLDGVSSSPSVGYFIHDIPPLLDSIILSS